ncbi:hypothetical protein POVCU2_0050920 [Plasmodium ovale curtisi]|uniref:Uncharacterized protein n=1 Tax=Plasmodium ovale curtisi TaxID=864141 RepID=A0A1A8X5C6_PLAOA|nr:hypothetical protein POVCU2_0050920 [Plasmodium ovale curtisi]SBT00451.1 hypothetical protein POVCU1_060070 [Plasmodium ovale curtisi]
MVKLGQDKQNLCIQEHYEKIFQKSNCSHYGDQNYNYNCRNDGYLENVLFNHRLKGRSGNLLMIYKNG